MVRTKSDLELVLMKEINHQQVGDLTTTTLV